MEKRDALIIVLVLLLVLAVNRFLNMSNKVEENTELQNSLRDSLSFYKNEKGELVGRISTLRASNASTFLDLSTKDEQVVKLQNLVSRYEKELSEQGSAGIITIEGETTIVKETVVDTVNGTYSADFNKNNWIWGKVVASKDSIRIDLNSREEVSFVIGRERSGFLGLGKPEFFSDVTLGNPYNEVTSFRTYDTSVPITRWHLTAGISAIYDFNTQNIVVGPGVTLGFTIFRW